MVSGFDEGRERADSKRGAQSGIESEVVQGFGAGDVGLDVVQPAAGNQVRLCAGSRKGEYQIE